MFVFYISFLFSIFPPLIPSSIRIGSNSSFSVPRRPFRVFPLFFLFLPFFFEISCFFCFFFVFRFRFVFPFRLFPRVPHTAWPCARTSFEQSSQVRIPNQVSALGASLLMVGNERRTAWRVDWRALTTRAHTFRLKPLFLRLQTYSNKCYVVCKRRTACNLL